MTISARAPFMARGIRSLTAFLSQGTDDCTKQLFTEMGNNCERCKDSPFRRSWMVGDGEPVVSQTQSFQDFSGDRYLFIHTNRNISSTCPHLEVSAPSYTTSRKSLSKALSSPEPCLSPFLPLPCLNYVHYRSTTLLVCLMLSNVSPLNR